MSAHITIIHRYSKKETRIGHVFAIMADPKVEVFLKKYFTSQCSQCPVLRKLGPRNWLLNGVAGPDGKCRNDSMSFVDVRDCAAQHVAAMETEKEGRFMSFLAING